MRITEAAERLGTSPRMLRYRDLLGLLPPVRVAPSPRRAVRAPRPDQRPPGSAHRQFSEEDLAAARLALRIEQRYDVSPAALAFGLRVLTEPGVRADVAELGRRVGPPPARALDFEQQRAMRLLGQAGGPPRRSDQAGGPPLRSGQADGPPRRSGQAGGPPLRSGQGR